VQEEFFRQLVERAPDVIFRYELRPKRAYVYVNPTISRVLGYSPDEFYADPEIYQKLVHPDDSPLLAKLSEAPSTFTLRCRHKNGGWRSLEHHSVPVLDAAGDVVAIESIVHDVTKQNLGEATRKNEAAELDQLRQMTRVAVHQINNTLTEAMGLLDIVRHRASLAPPMATLIGQALASVTTASQQLAKLQQEVHPK